MQPAFTGTSKAKLGTHQYEENNSLCFLGSCLCVARRRWAGNKRAAYKRWENIGSSMIFGRGVIRLLTPNLVVVPFHYTNCAVH